MAFAMFSSPSPFAHVINPYSDEERFARIREIDVTFVDDALTGEQAIDAARMGRRLSQLHALEVRSPRELGFSAQGAYCVVQG